MKPYYSDESVTIYHADAEIICSSSLPKIDLVLTDPPFGVGNFVQITGNVRGEEVFWNDSPPDAKIFNRMREISSNQIIWGANYFNCFDSNGGAIIWVKNQPMPNFSKADIASCSFHKKVEIFTHTWTNFVNTKQTPHPCERPVALYAWCLATYSKPGEMILDPYMGSGSVLRAAKNVGCRAIGIEADERWCEVAANRMSQGSLNFGEMVERELCI